MFRIFFTIFIIVFVALGYLGAQAAEEPYITIAQVCTFWYFFHFLVVLPLLGKFEKPQKLPESISAHVQQKGRG